MKRNIRKRLFAYLLTAALVSAPLTGCHDDDGSLRMPATSPTVEATEGGCITSFSLQSHHFALPEDIDSVAVTLIPRDGTTRCFDAKVSRDGAMMRFHMQVPSADTISDGEYVLTMSNPAGRSIPGRLSVSFEGGLLTSVEIILPKFMLDGSGTEDDPYLIRNDDDFSMFLINLADDADVYGAGLKFCQTADVVAPDQSSLIPGRGYWGAPFAGIYDGGGHSIRSLYYHGGKRESSDSGIGLFTSLLGSASVENLTLSEVAMTGIYKESGVIAGRTSGNITLSHVSVSGSLRDGYAIGGLIGCITDGTVKATDVELRMAVGGTDDVGGLVGRVDDKATFSVDGVTTPNHQFSVAGDKSVGGIIGRSKGAVNISRVYLDHKVSGEDSDINIIYGSAEGVGGVIGTITSDARDCSLRSCYVECPVGGDGSNVGGVIGQVMSHNAVRLEECRMYSVVSGGDNVGGLIGKADMPSGVKGVVIEGSDFSTRIVADDADAKVEGLTCTGGFCGLWKGPLSLKAKVRINLPVEGGNSTGGAFGRINDSSVDVAQIVFGPSAGANTMKVRGSVNVGGLAGFLDKSTLRGESKFDYADGNDLRVPAPAEFDALFNGLVEGQTAVGGLVGYATASNLQYLCSEAVVTGSEMAGGVVGRFYDPGKSTNIEDCTFKGRLNCTAATDVGGIIGYYESKEGGVVHDCVNYSPVAGGENTGGIIGRVMKGYALGESVLPVCEVKWCVNLGEVSGRLYAGGIIGRHNLVMEREMAIVDATNFNISNCMNGATVRGDGSTTSTGGVGGIIGFSSCYIGVFTCANHGDIYGSGPFHGLGGIAGSLGLDPPNFGIVTGYRNLDVKECCNTGKVDSSDSGSQVGGILGYQEEGYMSDVLDCHNSGPIPCDQKHDTGGIVGCVDHETNIHRCVNQGKVNHGNATIGTHKTGSLFDHSALYYLNGTGSNWPSAIGLSASDFKNQSKFGGLDFSKVWIMGSDGPELRNCRWRHPSSARTAM